MAAAALFTNFKDKTYKRVPGHWLLASMGKRVLRPGGLEMSRWLIDNLKVKTNDDVVELAPGLGRTARLILERNPNSYTGVEQNEAAAAVATKIVTGPRRSICVGNAEATGLSDGAASIICGEAFLTMQSAQIKVKILREVARVLKPGGLYGLHELSLATESPELIEQVQRELSESIRVNARPVSVGEWKRTLDEAGFDVVHVRLLPMALLEPGRLMRDEGLGGVLRISTNLLRHPAALKRILRMRRHFRKRSAVLQAVGIVARKR